MGNSQEQTHNFSMEPNTSDWMVKERLPYMNVWCRKDNPAIELEEYPFRAHSESDFKNQEETYFLRRDHPTLVASYYFTEQKSDDFCSTASKGHLFIERIPLRLSNITDIPFPDILHVYSQCLKGFQLLKHQFGSFSISQENICINTAGVVKVWLSQRLQRSYTTFNNASEQTMVRQIVQILETNTDRESTPREQPSILNFIYQFKDKSTINFREAQIALTKYAEKYAGGQIPTKLKCVDLVGGIEVVKRQILSPQTILQRPHQQIIVRKSVQSPPIVRSSNNIVFSNSGVIEKNRVISRATILPENRVIQSADILPESRGSRVGYQNFNGSRIINREWRSPPVTINYRPPSRQLIENKPIIIENKPNSAITRFNSVSPPPIAFNNANESTQTRLKRVAQQLASRKSQNVPLSKSSAQTIPHRGQVPSPRINYDSHNQNRRTQQSSIGQNVYTQSNQKKTPQLLPPNQLTVMRQIKSNRSIQPVIAQPVIAQPVIAQPVIAPPVIAPPVMLKNLSPVRQTKNVYQQNHVANQSNHSGNKVQFTQQTSPTRIQKSRENSQLSSNVKPSPGQSPARSGQPNSSDIFEARAVQASNIIQNPVPIRKQQQGVFAQFTAIGKGKPIHQSNMFSHEEGNYYSQQNNQFDNIRDIHSEFNQSPQYSSKAQTGRGDGSGVEWQDYTQTQSSNIQRKEMFNKGEKRVHQDSAVRLEEGMNRSSAELLSELTQVKKQATQQIRRSRHEAEQDALSKVRNQYDQIMQRNNQAFGSYQPNLANGYNPMQSVKTQFRSEYEDSSKKTQHEHSYKRQYGELAQEGHTHDFGNVEQQKIQETDYYHIEYDPEILNDLRQINS